MTHLNAVGDLVLTDPRAMRALADASRLALHDALGRRGPATADELASLLDAEPSRIVEDLELLEDVGLVERQATGSGDAATWATIGKGIYFEIPDDADAQLAARQLANTMYLQYVDVPRRWVSDSEPRLSVAWARAAGLLNVGVRVTPEELQDIQAELERVFEPYLRRRPDDMPPDAARVRLLGYFLPEPPEGEGS